MGLYRIKYHGTSDTRIIGADHLKERYNIEVSQDLVWSADNHNSVYMSEVPEPLEEIFRREGTFTVTEVEPGTGKEITNIVEGRVLDDTGFMVIDAVTGQVSSKGESNADADPAPIVPKAPKK